MRAKEFITEFETFDEMALPATWDPKVFKYKKGDIDQLSPEPFEKMIQYAKNKRAPHLGRGMERSVKKVKDPKSGKQVALKIAHNPYGLYQNKSDKEVFSNPQVKKIGITIPLIDYDRKNKEYPAWIQTAIADPIKGNYFKQNYGYSIEDIVDYVFEDQPSWKIEDNIDTLLNNIENESQRSKLSTLLDKLHELYKLEFNIADLYSDNWGIYQGKPVIIDAGFFKQEIYEQVLDEMPIPATWKKSKFEDKVSFKDMLEYVKDQAPTIGEGSSRIAVIIPHDEVKNGRSRDTVLKVAKNTNGVNQTLAEKRILDKAKESGVDIVIPYIDAAENGRWIHTELAQPFKSDFELCKLIKCRNLDDLVDYAELKITNTIPAHNKYKYKDVESYKKGLQNELFRGKTQAEINSIESYATQMAKLASFGLILNDLAFFENWGKYENKAVIIDLGFTAEVHKLMVDKNGKLELK